MAEDGACGNVLQQAAATLHFLTRPREDPLHETWQIRRRVPHHLKSFFQLIAAIGIDRSYRQVLKLVKFLVAMPQNSMPKNYQKLLKDRDCDLYRSSRRGK